MMEVIQKIKITPPAGTVWETEVEAGYFMEQLLSGEEHEENNSVLENFIRQGDLMYNMELSEEGDLMFYREWSQSAWDEMQTTYSHIVPVFVSTLNEAGLNVEISLI